jgi:single-stranded DNA-binding protein
VPVFIYGANAERAAEEVEAGDLIAVDGRLSWKSTLKKDGMKLGLCVTTFGVEVLVKAAVKDESMADLELMPKAEPMDAPPVKSRRPRYPKWKPAPAELANWSAESTTSTAEYVSRASSIDNAAGMP